MAYQVDLNDERLTEVKDEEKAKLSETEKLYGGLIDQTQGYYDAQIQHSKDYAKEQEDLLNEQTDFTIDKIEQQREYAKKDYTKEQAGAYVDWQKQSNPYGVNAEKRASMGMDGTGFSESSQVSMYNQYQNRVATAREAFIRTNENFDNGIREAKMQNSVALAEIKAKAHQQQLELATQGFLHKQELVLGLADKKLQVEQIYHNKWKDVLSQINTEKAYELDERQVKLAEDKWAYEKSQQQQEQQRIIKQRQETKDSAKAIRESKGVKTNKNKAIKIAGSITTERGAREFFTQYGIQPDTPLLSSIDWNKAKRTGELGSDLEAYDSYAEYVQAYCSWAVNEFM